MSKQVVKILEAHFINHDVKRFVIEKPAGFTFVPGQAADVSINLPGWEDKLRPFTFTGLTNWEHLELIVKIYADHNGVTSMLGKINAGGELILHNVFGAIAYKKPGVFLAGGTGVTPFIAILRELYRKKAIFNNRLIHSVRTSEDLILPQELLTMLGENFVPVYTREGVIGFIDKHIDRKFLIENIADFSQQFYVCGPEGFVENMSNMLLDLGAKAESLVIDR